MQFDQLETYLQSSIFPDLDRGRPNWDKPHTQAVVHWLKQIFDHTPELALDHTVLFIAAYAHDWGYAGLFDHGQPVQHAEVMSAKDDHMQLGADKLAALLQHSQFDTLTIQQKQRAIHIVSIHDKLDQLTDTDELILMEADTLGGLDTDYIKPTFSPESNQKYMAGVRTKRLPRFITDFGKQQADLLFQKRLDYYAIRV